MEQKVAIVTGSNKGIGFEIVKVLCKRFDGAVYLTSRDRTRGELAAEELKKSGLNPHFHVLDVADRSSIQIFREHIEKTHGGIDILINNAGVAALDDNEDDSIADILNINYRSALTIQELLFPLLRNNARVINVSSDCGHLSNLRNRLWIERLSKKDLTVEDIEEFVRWFVESKRSGSYRSSDFADGGKIAAYRVSKMALAALTFVQQREVQSRGVVVTVMHPGLVATDMTSAVGFYTPEQAARTPLHLALDAPAHEIRGAYVWYDGSVLDWYDYNADYYFKYETLSKKYN